MAFADSLLQKLFEFLPLVITFICVVSLLWVAHLLLIKRNADKGNEKQFSNQLIMLEYKSNYHYLLPFVAAVF